MQLIEKAYVLADFWSTYRDHELCSILDLGMPYSFGVTSGDISSLTHAGEQEIDSAWRQFCEFFGLETEGNYASLNVDSLFETD
jgi:hypothetical protein